MENKEQLLDAAPAYEVTTEIIPTNCHRKNRVTGTIIELVKEKVRTKCIGIGGGWVERFYFLKCVDHNQTSHRFRYRTGAIDAMPRPWWYCDECMKILREKNHEKG